MLELQGLHRLHIEPIHLKIDSGSCVSVAGKSGAGKSLILRMIADLDPHSGDSLLDGEPCSGMPAPLWRRQVTYVAAESAWWDDIVKPHFAPGTDLASLLPQIGIAPEAAQWPVARLSTGERQRLALLRALSRSNRVLLLDEPTSGLDPASTAQVEALLTSRLASGASIVLVTHDADQARRMATRHIEIRDGCLYEVSR